MAFIDEQLVEFKRSIEEAIREKGVKGKESVIRSSALINLIHDAVKYELIEQGVNPDKIHPKLYDSKPEIKLAGFFKQKNQDICVFPSNIEKKQAPIVWGPLVYLNKLDLYGFEFTRNTLVINVRSQMSSLAKNADTLFERTITEAYNLHLRYPDIVLGEVYLIPTNEYDDEFVKENKIAFKERVTDIASYVAFFDSINNRKDVNNKEFAYEKCTLLIVDFNRDKPYLYNNTEELVRDGLLPEDFEIEVSALSFRTFAQEIIAVYAERHNLENLK